MIRHGRFHFLTGFDLAHFCHAICHRFPTRGEHCVAARSEILRKYLKPPIDAMIRQLEIGLITEAYEKSFRAV